MERAAGRRLVYQICCIERGEEKHLDQFVMLMVMVASLLRETEATP